jgi:glycosyltransferase involved in cell wall biosynthesis
LTNLLAERRESVGFGVQITQSLSIDLLKKIAVCCFYEAYPPASGAASVSYNLARFWPGDSLLIQVGARDERLVTDAGVRVVTLGGATESRLHRLLQLFRLIRRMTEEVASECSPVVVLEGASWAPYHWLLLHRLRYAVPQARVVYHAHNVEYLIRSQRHGGAIAALTRWTEAAVVKHSDIATAVSQVDREHFLRLYGVSPILLPNGVDTARFGGVSFDDIARLRAIHGLDERTLLFAGFYSYGPNREGIDFLVHSVMPALRERYPRATLALTGGGAPYSEPWLKNAGSIPYVDFASFVSSCGVAVAPIFSGSGTRLKILEAMAAGIPVVATDKAAEGLPLTHGKEILFASNAKEFVHRVGEIFDNPTLAAELCKQATQTIGSFSWDTIVGNFARDIL